MRLRSGGRSGTTRGDIVSDTPTNLDLQALTALCCSQSFKTPVPGVPLPLGPITVPPWVYRLRLPLPPSGQRKTKRGSQAPDRTSSDDEKKILPLALPRRGANQ
jgi:hypothetical protein